MMLTCGLTLTFGLVVVFAQETADDLEAAVRELFTDRLELAKDVCFDRLHRLNQRPNSPIIGCCTFFKDKVDILRARGKLKEKVHRMGRIHCCVSLRARVQFGLLVFLLLLLLVLQLQRQRLPRPSVSFKVQLTDQEQTALLGATDVFTTALTSADVPFFMFSGTLLGSWRHHGLIPWDDDVDFAMLFADRSRIQQALLRHQPDYVLNTDHPKRWKFFPAGADPISGVSWRFPFVDLNFLLVNETHIWNEDVVGYPTSVFLRAEVFPLAPRPFQGRQLPAPRDTKAVLEKDYDLGVCQTIRYYHREETGGHLVETAPCQTLSAGSPFVQRKGLTEGGGCNETLVVNNTVLRWQAFPRQPC